LRYYCLPSISPNGGRGCQRPVSGASVACRVLLPIFLTRYFPEREYFPSYSLALYSSLRPAKNVPSLVFCLRARSRVVPT